MQVACLGTGDGESHVAVETRHLGRGDGGGGGTIQVAGLCHSHHLQDSEDMSAVYFVMICSQGLLKIKILPVLKT